MELHRKTAIWSLAVHISKLTSYLENAWQQLTLVSIQNELRGCPSGANISRLACLTHSLNASAVTDAIQREQPRCVQGTFTTLIACPAAPSDSITADTPEYTPMDSPM